MKTTGTLILLLGLFVTLRGDSIDNAVNNRAVPTFSGVYTATGVINLPYAEIREPFTAYYDETAQKSRVDYYNGVQKSLQLAGLYGSGQSLLIVPVTDQQVFNQNKCFAVNGSSDSPISIQSVFPDLTGFTYANKELKRGISCAKWVKEETIFQKLSKYSFWVSITDGSPVHYQMKGYDFLFGSHYDKYEIEYFSYDPTAPDPIVFEANITCGDFPGPGVSHVHLHNPIREFVNGEVNHVHQEFERFKVSHGKRYDTHAEHQKRKSIFHQNMRFIHSTNRKGLSYKLKINHLADQSHREFRRLRGKLYTPGYNGGQPFNKEAYENTALPDTLDWRLQGAVTPVKDQAICGSCWTFGTTGTIEGAYYLKTGRLVRLSEQALVDCAWGPGNNGCNGGEDWRAYKWIMLNHGVPTDDTYGPYIGQDGLCNAYNSTTVAQIHKYYNVTSGDVEALRLAIFKHGPISVAIDASQKDFSFYSHGVYYNPACKNTPEGLDHAVLAVGYGTLNNNDYWLIKNSWSTYWGNDGYILISRKDNNCGVATDGTFVQIE